MNTNTKRRTVRLAKIPTNHRMWTRVEEPMFIWARVAIAKFRTYDTLPYAHEINAAIAGAEGA